MDFIAHKAQAPSQLIAEPGNRLRGHLKTEEVLEYLLNVTVGDFNPVFEERGHTLGQGADKASWEFFFSKALDKLLTAGTIIPALMPGGDLGFWEDDIFLDVDRGVAAFF